MTDFPLVALRSVDLDVIDPAASGRFYEDVWGLRPVGSVDGVIRLRGTGRDHHLVALHRGDRPAIRSFTFRAAPDTDLAALARRVADHGGRDVTGIAPSDNPAGGAAFAFRDPRGRTVRIVQGDMPVDPLPDDADRPERLAHVNINSTDVDADVAFFVDALGFRLTDRSKMMGFVRTNDDHHSIVIAEAPVDTLNHIAFQLPTWEGVMRASGRMVDAGFGIGWGPGRHGPGDNVFTYFVSPDGIVIEHTAEVLQVDDDYRAGGPQDWTWPAGRTDQWGICPPKTGACKAAQLAIPFA